MNTAVTPYRLVALVCLACLGLIPSYGCKGGEAKTPHAGAAVAPPPDAAATKARALEAVRNDPGMTPEQKAALERQMSRMSGKR